MKLHNLLFLLVLTLAVFVVSACGDDVNKKTLAPTNNGTSTNNTSPNGTANNTSVNNVSTSNIGTNNTTGNIDPNNSTANNTTGNNTTGNNSNANNTTGNNTTGNNTTGNNTTNATIVFVPGEDGTFDTALDEAGFTYQIVAGDDPSVVLDFESFVLNDLGTVDILVIDKGLHLTNLSDQGGDVTGVVQAVQAWMNTGGRLVDLSGGIRGRIGPWPFPGRLVATGNYAATADPSLPHQGFTLNVPSEPLMPFVPVSQLSSTQEVLARANVRVCMLPENTCGGSDTQPMALIVRETFGQGQLLHSTFIEPHNAQVTDLLVALLTL